MYIQDRRESSNFNGSCPLKHHNGLISMKPAIDYFAYTERWEQSEAGLGVNVRENGLWIMCGG